MVKMSGKSIRYAVFVALLLATAYALRFLPVREGIVIGRVTLSGNIDTLVRAAIYTGVIVAWGISVQHRVIHPRVKRLFAVIAALDVFWMIFRTVKFMLPRDCPDMMRLLWYLYYIPMLFIPLSAFLLSLRLGRSEDYQLPSWTRYLYVAAAALLLLVLSNDLHQLVFSHLGGVRGSSDADAVYEPLFYPVFAWRIAGLLAVLVTIFVRSRVPQSGKRLIMPLIPSVLLLLYGAAYTAGWLKGVRFFEDLTVTECMLVIAIWESCLRCGLIPSNTHYAELFGEMGYPAVIVDEDYIPVYSTDAFVSLPEEVMRQAERAPVEVGEGLILKSMSIGAGHILWTENIAELIALQEQAKEMAKELAEEKDLLQAEIEMKQRQAAIDTRNRLYDSVVHEISPQFEEIDRLVSAVYQSEGERRAAMKRMCVIGAYVKRRCNLLFLSEVHQSISSEELVHCLRESADYIGLCGAECTLNTLRFGMVPAEQVKIAYDLFERVVETVLPTLSAMLICMDCSAAGLSLNIQSECGAGAVELGDLQTALRDAGGTAEYVCEEGVLYTRLRFL